MSRTPAIAPAQAPTPPATPTGLPTPASSDTDASSLDSKRNEVEEIGKVSDSAFSSEDELRNKYYEPPDTYESKHRWDPLATWTAPAERRIVRRLDLRVACVAYLCFFALCLDRSNLGNALADNLLKDIGATTQDYNIANTLFYCCFLVAELPSQMISKKLGSDRWIPIQMMAWSVVAIMQCIIKDKHGLWACRALIGLIEGGFVADMILWLSYWYTSAELTMRMSFFFVTLTMTNIVGAFLAVGILELRHVTAWAGWRWLFLLEGIVTLAIGIFAAFYLPPSPTETKSRFNKKGWFTAREEVIIVNRVLRDDPTKSDMHNRQGLSLDDFKRSLLDYDLWPIYLLGLTTYIAPATVGKYFTLNLRSLGYSVVQTNLLTVPTEVLTIITNIAACYGAKRTKQPLAWAGLGPLWILPLLIALVMLPDSTSKWVKWAVMSLLKGYPFSHPILVSMTSMNAGSVRTRTVASAVYNMFVQLSSIVASNVYQPDDAPYYHKGNRTLLGAVVANIVLFGLAKLWFVWRNGQRAHVWDAWTFEEKEQYLATTTDKGNKRLDFRFEA